MVKLRKKLSALAYIRIFKHLRVSIWFFPCLCCAAAFDYLGVFSLAFLSALLHETGHILAARAVGVNISEVVIYPFGVCARLSAAYIKSPVREFFISLCGPVTSLLLYAAAECIYLIAPHPLLTVFSGINLALCALNLLPCLPLDGGRMLKSILSDIFGIIRAYNLMLTLSRVIIGLILTASAVLFLMSDFNFSLILVSAFLLSSLAGEQKSITHIILREILDEREKLSRAMRARTLCVTEATPVRTLLRYLSYDRTYIIHIVGQSSEIKKTITEGAALRALTEHGIRISYGDI